jgi:dethiobiotin synthetase
VLRGLFVTGTDTGIGKTVVSAALMHRHRAATAVRYWKPIQTGIEADDDTATVMRLGQCGEEEVLREGIRLPRPLSPHLAARLAGIRISIDALIHLASAAPDGRFWIVEGAGGVLVPINDRDLMIDLIARLGLPALVVARSTLGTINHTLLTLTALRRKEIAIAGVVMVGEPNDDNRTAVETYGGVPVLGEIPVLADVTPEEVRAAATSFTSRYAS